MGNRLADDDRVREELANDGFSICRNVVPGPTLDALRDAVDRAVIEEREDFPVGDDQHGRLLFAPAHGGALLELCGFDPLFEPMERILGEDSILYTMTTSVLSPQVPNAASDLHVDMPADRPDGLAIGAMVMLDPFTSRTGATQFLPGSHRIVDGNCGPSIEPRLVCGQSGDVCYFDPRTLHRSTLNRSDSARRALLMLMVRPWMKQRVDVAAMLGTALLQSVDGVARRRLGLTSLAPRSRAEFLARRVRRPW